jgi:hypothetical protein
VVVNMPRKAKPSASQDKVWVAPRPANESKSKTFEPVGVARSNRYLEFADIALRVKQAPQHRQKDRGTAGDEHKSTGGKVTPINRARLPRFGAFRNPR